MFEIQLALKYLIPRWRQLSVSIISLLSIAVIALVVWLVVVFFSVTHGLERGWTEKMIALTAPLRLTPTEAYTDSYYFNIDRYALLSDYTEKSFSEKLSSTISDPYDPDMDVELPAHLPAPDLDENGELRDLAQLAMRAAATVGAPRDYEMTVANIRIDSIRPNSRDPHSFVSQASFILSFDPHNPDLDRSLLPLDERDHANSSLQLDLLGREPTELAIRHTDEGWELPRDEEAFGVLVARHFKESDIHVGDRGFLSYHTFTTSNLQEQRVPIYIAGFYDPGIIGIGGKMVLVDKSVTTLIRAARQQQNDITTTGVNIWLDDYERAPTAKVALEKRLEELGISQYFKVETYEEYDFTRSILQQLKSDRNLFSIISFLVILVACSNIITLLILLVNDKKREIGILRAMGAKASSIAMIFGLCGLIMGGAGGLIGVLLALVTLRYLQPIIDLISAIQGFDAFNESFYGEVIPNAVSSEALLFVLLATSLLSLLAGTVPAIKAALLRPSEVLRGES